MRPRHPYTQRPAGERADARSRASASPMSASETSLPDPANIPPGCRFHPRCAIAVERCRNTAPVPRAVEGGGMVECHLADTTRPAPASFDAVGLPSRSVQPNPSGG